MKTYVAPTDEIAAGLYSGKISLIVLPMMPQPEFETLRKENGNLYGMMLDGRPTNQYIHRATPWRVWDGHPCGRHIASRFIPGDIVGILEPFYVQPEIWAEHHGPQPIHYAIDGYVECLEDYEAPPSDQMPKWAIRTHIRILSVEGRQVRCITEDESNKAGAMAWWNSLSVEQQVFTYTGGCGPYEAFKCRWNHLHPDLPFDTSWVWIIRCELETKGH